MNDPSLVVAIERFPFPGWGSARSYCLLEVFSWEDGQILVVASERADNPGPSITNAVEPLWALVDTYLASFAPFRRFEHYIQPAINSDTICEVLMADGQVTWQPVAEPEIEGFLRGASGRVYQVPGSFRAGSSPWP